MQHLIILLYNVLMHLRILCIFREICHEKYSLNNKIDYSLPTGILKIHVHVLHYSGVRYIRQFIR